MDSQAQTLWSAALASLQSVLNAEVFRLWFAPIQAVSLTADKLTLSVPNEFCGVWLGENYRDVIEDALATAGGRAISFTFVAMEKPTTHAAKTGPAVPEADRSKVATRTAVEVVEAAEPLSLFDPKNTFDSFVVGNNTFAHAAAVAVAHNRDAPTTRCS